MSEHTNVRIELANDQESEKRTAPESHKLGFEALEGRITPLVVIAIIAILIGLLLPAVQ